MLRKPPFPEKLYKESMNVPVDVITREEWGAEPPTKVEYFTTYPVENMVFGYTETDECTTKEECIQTMRSLQQLHKSQGHSDIRYSFVMGADMNMYEGRGWKFKAGNHNRFPELKGNNIEIVHTGKRGGLPDPERSAIVWHLLDIGENEGHLARKLKYFQDYEDPPPPFDIEAVAAIKPDVDLRESLMIQ